MRTWFRLSILVLILVAVFVLPAVALAAPEGQTGPPAGFEGVPSLPEFLRWLQTPAGLAVAVWLILEICKGQVDKPTMDRWGLALAVGLSIVLPLAALLISAALGLSFVTADTLWYAMAAAFLVSQGFFGVSNGLAKLARARESPI
jgi:hypothetical protein